ncbi:MAG: hypothetical protein NVSMB25_09610 [Thermoleophilaceae bacterium]
MTGQAGAPSARLLDESVWHDVECGGYAADLELWRTLAAEANGAVLDLGCGTGRVALDLAERGHDVTGLDSEPAFIRALSVRARERGLRVRGEVGDGRAFELGRSFALGVAPMQVVQLLGGAAGRARMLECVRRHLLPGGVFAAALADPFESVAPERARPPLPDLREEAGWVYSSMPVAVRTEAGATAIERLRQSVSPRGEITQSLAVVQLETLTAQTLEREAADCGFVARRRLSVPATDDYVGSAVVILERR